MVIIDNKFRSKKIKISICAFLVAVIPAIFVETEAQTINYAIAQFDNQNGIKFLIIQGYKKAECKKLISTFYASLRVDCPRCTKDYETCTTNIGAYQNVWENKKYLMPYFSSGGMRIILSGIQRSEIEHWCNDLVNKYRSNGRVAVCIK